jgi:hypothetical protein
VLVFDIRVLIILLFNELWRLKEVVSESELNGCFVRQGVKETRRGEEGIGFTLYVPRKGTSE